MTLYNLPAKYDCHCKDRQEAQRSGKFFYATAHAGFVYKDTEGVPRRKDGRAFVWVTCPFCGGDLMDRGELGW